MPNLVPFVSVPFCLYPRRAGEREYDPQLPVRLTHHKARRLPPGVEPSYWAFDSCYAGQALSSPAALLAEFGLIAARVGDLLPPDQADRTLIPNDSKDLYSEGIGLVEGVPIYRARLWLVSDRPEYADRPYPIDLSNAGVAGLPGRTRSLVGRGAFIGTGVEVRLAFDRPAPTLSVWVPEDLIPPADPGPPA